VTDRHLLFCHQRGITTRLILFQTRRCILFATTICNSAYASHFSELHQPDVSKVYKTIPLV